MDTRIEAVSFESGSERIGGRLFIPAAVEGQPYPAMVLVHGLGSGGTTMDGCAKDLASRGIAALRFDQRGHGRAVGVYRGNSSDDVLAAASYLRDLPPVDAGRVGVVGHSSGARDALVACATDPHLEPLVCTSTPLDNAAGDDDSSFVSRTRVHESRDGRPSVSRYPQDGPLPWLEGRALRTFSWISGWVRGYRLRVDWRATFEAWARARPSIVITQMEPRPTLIVHTENDRAAPVEGAEILFMKASGPKEFFVRPGGYHSTPVRKGPLRSAWVDWIEEQFTAVGRSL